MTAVRQRDGESEQDWTLVPERRVTREGAVKCQIYGFTCGLRP